MVRLRIVCLVRRRSCELEAEKMDKTSMRKKEMSTEPCFVAEKTDMDMHAQEHTSAWVRS